MLTGIIALPAFSKDLLFVESSSIAHPEMDKLKCAANCAAKPHLAIQLLHKS